VRSEFGKYMPSVPVEVSVITPTFGRQRFHPALHAMFAAQQHDAIELLVDDDSPSPSPYFAQLSDPRVRYTHSPVRASIGAKRNRLIERARGAVIVAFDDDDYYAPHYVPTMLAALGNADLVKLAGWYVYSVPERTLYYWDTSAHDAVHFKVGNGPAAEVSSSRFALDALQRNLDGYGFSYVFRRAAFERARFPDLNFGEDFAFVAALRSTGARVERIQDEAAVVAHLMHGRTTSMVFPQRRLDAPSTAGLFPGLDAHLKRVVQR
jgi:glycosyltransferase involved in cell wall biosynthesis